MRILLLCSAFNGLSQRAWTLLRARGHQVTVQTVHDPRLIPAAVAAADPELIICPFLRQRVPDEVWRRYRTIVIHPGPPGDRGPSALDWAIMQGERRWGVTALQATGDLDAGPIWASRTFEMPADPPRKSTIYNAEVSDAAMSLIGEVLAKAEDPWFTPTGLDGHRSAVVGEERPLARQADRAFCWTEPTAHILRRIRAADGRPGVRSTLAGMPVSVFDAHPGSGPPGEPGSIVARRHGAVLVRTGDGAVWIGHLRRLAPTGAPALAAPSVKLPATLALGRAVGSVPEMLEPLEADQPSGFREITYRRLGRVGMVGFDFYNGAMSTAQCHRLAAAIRHAAAQDTAALVLRGGEVFSNGMHLGVIEAHRNPASEAWRNINAINEVCHEIITCTHQVVISAVGGNAGAGGVMLALGADRVIARDGVMLNPHYRTMGLFGSEYWTYVLPRRVGDEQAHALTTRCEPVSAAHAANLGLVDEVSAADRAEFEAVVLDYAAELAAHPRTAALLDRKRAARDGEERHRPLDTYRVRELAEMSQDIFDNRNGFAQARRAFLTNQAPAATSARLPVPRFPGDEDASTEPRGRWSALTAKLAAAWR